MLEGFKINCYPLNRSIRISVHLPKDYNSTNRFYPVLYLLDGQNLYTAQDSYRGASLELEETIQKLSNVGKEVIYIGIAAASNPLMRKEEYSTTTLADFILNSIHPYLSSRYRFNSFIYAVGCSNAAFTALLLTKSDIIKGCCLISPVLDTSILSEDFFPENKLYYIYAGENELSSTVKKNAIHLKQYIHNPQIVLDANEIHDESAWKDKLFEAFNYLVL